MKMISIDEFHKNQMEYFNEIKTIIIPNFKKEKEQLKSKLLLENKIENRLYIIDEIKNIKQKIFNIKFLEKNYLLKNIKHLEIYYNNKKDVENNINEKSNLNDFFNVLPIEKEVNTNRDFWNVNDKPFIDYYNQSVCTVCNIEMKETEYGFFVCEKCNSISKNIINENKNENNMDRIINNSCYLRLSYFKKIINQLNGRATMKISTEVIQIIKNRIEIEKLKNINYYIIKELLKKLKLKKYIDQIVHILSLLGIHIIQMPDTLINKLCSIFQSLQEPFHKYCDKSRVNFFPYHFIVYELLMYLGEKQYIQHNSILKNIEKNQNQNELFEKCINEITI